MGVTLRAINGSCIKTYGKKTVRLQLGRSHFTHTFVVTDLPSGLLGWDFMTRFGIDMSWKNDNCRLKKGNRVIPLHLERVENELVGLQVAEMDFKSYSAAHKVTEGGAKT